MRALALVGNGAKHLGWFEFGPEPIFPGNCYSELAMQEVGNSSSVHGGRGTSTGTGTSPPGPSIFTEIAEASKMIAAAEHLLHPGRIETSQIAILYPRSSWIWDTVQVWRTVPGALLLSPDDRSDDQKEKNEALLHAPLESD